MLSTGYNEWFQSKITMLFCQYWDNDQLVTIYRNAFTNNQMINTHRKTMGTA